MRRLQLSGRVLAFLDEGVKEGADAAAYGDGDVVAMFAVERRFHHEADAFELFARGR